MQTEMVGMSALGHRRTFAVQYVMSALHPKADMCGAKGYVRFVPIADIPPFSEATKVTPRPYLSGGSERKKRRP